MSGFIKFTQILTTLGVLIAMQGCQAKVSLENKIAEVNGAGKSEASPSPSPSPTVTSTPGSIVVVAATPSAWTEGSYSASTTIHANWTVSPSIGIVQQTLQLYTGSCATPAGSPVSISLNNTSTYAFTGVNGSSYSFQVVSTDYHGISATSNCSSIVLVDTTFPTAATPGAWTEGTYSTSTTFHANWAVSASADVVSQKIQLYTGSCSATSGSLITLASATTTQTFTGTHGSTYSYKVTSTDVAGNATTSACSASIIVDTVAPSAPASWSMSSPTSGSTSSSTTPTISGTGAEASAVVALYVNSATCATTSIGSGTVAGAGTFSIMSSALSTDGLKTIYYKITDPAGNASACAATGLSYTLDTTSPTAPTGWTMSSPNSGTSSSDGTPQISASAGENGATVKLYTDSSCALTQFGSTATVAGGTFSITDGSVSVDGLKTFYYKITDTQSNASACTATGLSYTYDTTAPNAPTSWSMASPNSGVTSSDVNPAITGNAAENTAVVKVWVNDAACTNGMDAGSGAVAGGAFSISAFNLGTSELKTFYFTITDTQGNATSCATTGLSYTLDITAPTVATSVTWLESSPYNSLTLTPTWIKSVSGDLANQQLQFYSDAACSVLSGGVVNLGSAAIQTSSFTAPSQGTYAFKVISIDTYSNQNYSACSGSITLDTTAPTAATPLGWTEGLYSANLTIHANWTVSGSGDVASQSVQLYTGTCAVASGAPVSISNNTTATYAFIGTNGSSYSFKVTSTDTAGNAATSACSAVVAVDTTAPTAATPAAWTEGSYSASTAINANWAVSVSADVVSQSVQLYTGTCAAGSGAPVSISNNTTATYAFTGANGTAYSFKVTSTDTSGNATVSACSSTVTVDTSAPLAATPAAWTEGSYSASTTIHANWTVSASSDVASQSVQLYTGLCAVASGAPAVIANNTTAAYAFTGSNGTAYSFKVTSSDSAGNATASACSSTVTVDTSAPVAGTPAAWSEGSYSASTTINANWTVSASGDVASQSVQLFTGTCAATSGAPVVIANNTTSTNAFTGLNGVSYSFKITSSDSAGNSATSVCSSTVAVDTSAPAAATPAAWTEGSYSASTTINANWVVSASGDVVSQSVQYYTDSCVATSGAPVVIANGTTATNAFTGANGSSYSYKVTSTDSAGNASTSACSAVIIIDTSAPTVTGLSNDTTPTQSKTWNWGCSETCTYQYVIDTTSNTTPASAYGATISDSQSAGSAVYYLHVRAKDAAGNLSSIVHVSVIIDHTAPTVPSVLNDFSYLNSLSSSPAITYAADSTDTNGVDHYDVALGTSAGASDVVGWTANGTGTTKTFSSLSLTTNTTYYASVRAVDEAGNISGTRQGDGWIADTTLPTAPTAVTLGAVPTNLSDSPTISWTVATDTGGSGVSYYGVQLHKASDHSVVQSWSTLTSGLALTGLSLTDGDAYYVKVRAIDNAGNVDTSYGTSANWTAALPTCASGSTTLSYTGSSQTFVVGAYCTSITVKAWGAGGAGSDIAVGGGAGFAQATLVVTSGESLNVEVGQAGQVYVNRTGTGGGAGGGGASSVDRSGTRLLIAGGGGGAGGAYNGTGGGAGGAGGGTTGTDGTVGDCNAGSGATAVAGGAGASTTAGCIYAGASGTSANGAAGGSSEVIGVGDFDGGAGGYGGGAAGGSGYATGSTGGGGGGGYYGGGGGASSTAAKSSGGGGGGSSYTTGTSTTNTAGSGSSAANSGDGDYGANAGRGGAAMTAGDHGRIVISY